MEKRGNIKVIELSGIHAIYEYNPWGVVGIICHFHHIIKNRI